MNKKFTILFTALLISASAFSKSPFPVYKEDVEILKLEEQIKSLQDRVGILKSEKEKRIKENKNEKKVALVLSGGGAKGFAHIGVLRELEKNNIKIDCIVGNSIGAVIGALYSVGYSPDEIEKIMEKLNLNDSLKDNPNRTDIPLEKRLSNDQYAFSIKYDSDFNLYLPKGLKNSQKGYLYLKELFSRAENISDFDKLPIPLRVVATNLNTGKATVFKNGDLAKVVTASAAIPSIFDPVNIDGTYYIDGMVSRNFPVEDAIDMGANIIIGVNVGADLKENHSENYNIFTTAEQLLAIQSASTTDFQKKLTSILIEPELASYKSVDYDSVAEIVDAGQTAAQKKLNEIKMLPKNKKPHISLPEKEFVFSQTVVEGINDKDRIAVIKNITSQYENKNLTTEELNNLSLKLYGLDFINKVYYKNEGDTLYLTLEETPSNTIGVGFNYQSDYYTSIKLATDLNTVGKFGNFTNIYVKGGDYLGAGVNSLFYYGVKNKFGFNTSLNYDESPLFIYENNNRIAKLKSKSINLEMSAFTLFLNEILVSYGGSLKYGSIKNDVSDISHSELKELDIDNYGQGFLKFMWDKADSPYYAKSGFKNSLDYFWGGSIDKQSSDFYGVLFSFEHFYPITKKLTLDSRLYGGSMNGTNIPYDGYIKLGGLSNSPKRREFSFYGYNPQQRFLENLFAAKIALQYEFIPNVFISSGFNIATYKNSTFNEKITDENFKDTMWEDYYRGIGLSIGYLSPVGPVEFSISHNDDFDDILYQFSLGYTFD